jgi:hypothetical protein
VAFFQRSATTRCTAMPPALVSFRLRVSTSAKPGASSSARYSVLTPIMRGERGTASGRAGRPACCAGSVTSTVCAPIFRNISADDSA